MNLKNWPIIPFIVIIALVAGLLFWEKSQIRKNKDSEVHYHAGFQVYIDDELQDFSDVKFMHIEPCSEEEHEEETEEHKQIELAHLHDGVGDVVHVHRNGATWGDLFRNINFSVSENVAAYVNGEPVENFLSYPIASYDSVIIIQGEINDLNKKLESAVTREHMIEAEAKSETCGS